jgi:surface polysaccharide O-acyltransferase-like enzyme
MRTRDRALESLSTNAYGIYLLHYIFVVWLQYALLAVDLNAIGKATIVFAGALTLSWAASAGLTTVAARHSDVSRKATMAHQPR